MLWSWLKKWWHVSKLRPVQSKTAQSWDNQVDLKLPLEADPEVTSRPLQEEIDEISTNLHQTVDEIFERVGLGD